ncbi:hypothetical protein D3C73_596230 [compost metagenome]
MRHDEAHGAAVFFRQRRAFPVGNDDRIGRGKVRKQKVRRVAVVARQHHRMSLLPRIDEIEEIAGGDTLPVVVVARPCGHAVDIGEHVRLRQGPECGPVERHRIVDEAVDLKFPLSRGNAWLLAEIKHRPVFHQMLAGRQPVGFRPGMVAGEEFSFIGPFALGDGKLGILLCRGVVGHLRFSRGYRRRCSMRFRLRHRII